MDEHTIKCDTQTRRNREQLKHIVHPIPNEKQGTSSVELPILLQRETSYGLGYTTTFWMTPEINPFQYAREINAFNTKGYEAYLIPNGWCRSLLRFSKHACIYNLLCDKEKQDKLAIYQSVRPTLAYIKQDV